MRFLWGKHVIVPIIVDVVEGGCVTLGYFGAEMFGEVRRVGPTKSAKIQTNPSRMMVVFLLIGSYPQKLYTVCSFFCFLFRQRLLARISESLTLTERGESSGFLTKLYQIRHCDPDWDREKQSRMCADCRAHYIRFPQRAILLVEDIVTLNVCIVSKTLSSYHF